MRDMETRQPGSLDRVATLLRPDGIAREDIMADPVPETGLGAVVMDRLRKSSGAQGGSLAGLSLQAQLFTHEHHNT
ncbi:MAG: hypothetical protein ABIH24_04425 [Verrucomicrobiota bacterium]